MAMRPKQGKNKVYIRNLEQPIMAGYWKPAEFAVFDDGSRQDDLVKKRLVRHEEPHGVSFAESRKTESKWNKTPLLLSGKRGTIRKPLIFMDEAQKVPEVVSST